MLSIARKAFIAALLAGVAGPAFAADPYEPVADPAPVVYQEAAVSDYGGWYIRGDLDYHWQDFRGADYVLYDPAGSSDSFDFGDIEDSWSLGGGIGYQINRHLRTDLTGDWMFDADFRGQTSDASGAVSVDRSKVSSFLLLANAYVDIGTWHGITPYVGAGIGGAWVKWDDLNNTLDDGSSFTHRGAKGWRFAYALSAGASYCLTQNLKFDAGYRFSHVEGGKMFEFESDGATGGAGPGYDDGFYNHEVRGGLRYQFGKSDCAEPEQVAYEPLPEPVYTK